MNEQTIETTAVAGRGNGADLRVLPATAQIADVQRLGGILAQSGYFGDAREQAQAAVKVLAGAELGIPPIAAMMGVHIIKGRAALGAHLIASRIRAHGYDFRVKLLDNSGCVLEFLSKPSADGTRSSLGESSFNEEDARAAGAFSDMYRRFPRNMYWARAVSNGAKWYTPEVMSGMPVYVPEELGAEVDAEGGVVQKPPTPADTAGRRTTEQQPKLDAPQPQAQKPQQPAQLTPAPTNAGDPASEPAVRPWDTFKGMVAAFEHLKKRLTPYDTPYYACLARYGVKHANEFKPSSLGVSDSEARQRAADCYRELLAKVVDYEAMKDAPATNTVDEHRGEEATDVNE